MDIMNMAASLADELAELDKELARAGDSSIGFKDTARANIAGKYTEDDFASRATAHLQGMSPEAALAYFIQLENMVKEKLGEKFDPILREETKRVKDSAPKVDVDETAVTALREKFNDGVKKWRSLEEVAKAWGTEDELADVARSAQPGLDGNSTFKPKRGSVGKRGKRLARKYKWTIDNGDTVYDNLSNVGVILKSSAADLRQVMVTSVPGIEKDDDLADEDKMPTVIEFDFKVGDKTRTIRGVEVEVEEGEEDAEDDEVDTNS